MNKDDLKPLLDKLNIQPTDEWTTIHKFPKGTFICYYYTFKVKNKTYCVSGDSISYVLSSENNPFMPMYSGYSIKELEKEIKGVLK